MKTSAVKNEAWNRAMIPRSLLMLSLILLWSVAFVESKKQQTKPTKFAKIVCPPNSNLTYTFKTTSLIGNRGLASSKKGSSGNVETQLSGELVLTCPSRKTNEKSGLIDKSAKNKNVILLTFNQVSFLQFQGSSKGVSGRKYRRLLTSKDMTKKMNEFPMIFIQSKTGHIQKMVFRQSETRYIRSLKKGILRLFTTETRRQSRSQTDGVLGKYRQNYHKQFRRGVVSKKRKGLAIYQKFTQDDFISFLPPSKRHLHYEGAHLVSVSLKKKVIRKAGLRLKVTFGPSKEVHYAFKEFERIAHSKIKKDDLVDNESKSNELETLFVGSVKLKKAEKTSHDLKEEIGQVIINLEKNGRDAKLGSQFQFENSFMTNKYDKKAMNQINRRRFSTKFFRRLLNAAKTDPSLSRNANSLLSALAKYSKLHPIKSAKILLNELKKGVDMLLNSNDMTEKQKISLKNYLESVQNLVATIRSAPIQEKLVKLSTLHPYLAKNYIYSSVVVPTPPKSAFSFLKLLKSKGLSAFSRRGNKKFKFSSQMNEDVKKNAFMAYADLAHRIRDNRVQQHIVKEILTKISASTNLNELQTYIHALNNAGKGVDIEIIRSFLTDKRIPDTIKVLLADNLKKRQTDESAVDSLINSLVVTKGLSSVVKASLINAQTEREKHLKSGASVTHFSKAHKKNKSEEIRTAVKNYLYTVGTKQSGEQLSKALKIKNKTSNALAKKVKKFQSSIESRALLSHEDLTLLEAFDEMERAQVLGIGRFFRRLGSRIKSAARAVGGAVRRAARVVGRGVARAARAVGRAVVTGAKAVAKGVVKAANWVKEKVEAAINAVTNVVNKIKSYFGPATFANQQACIKVSVDSEMCLRESTFIEFIRKQGDMSTIKKAKHFSFEALVGCQSINVYTGFLVYAGASFECSAENSGIDILLLAKAKLNAKLFSKEFVVIDGSAELTKRGEQPLTDNIYLKVFQTTFVNGNFVPEKIRQVIDACFSETKPIFEKRFPKLFSYNIQIMAGPIPISFNFNTALNTGVELKYGICLAKLEASSSLEPYVSLEVTGSASVGVPVAKAGIKLTATITYRIIPRIAFEKCNLCAMLQQRLDGVKFDVGLSATFMKWTKNWDFYSKQTKPYVKTLFEKCVSSTGYKPSSNDSPLQFTNKRDSEQPEAAATDSSAPEQNPQGYNTEGAPSTKNVATEGPSKLRKKVGSALSKKATSYQSMFGPNAEKIAVSGGAPPKPSKQTLRSPVTSQRDVVWSTAFLKQKVPAAAIKDLGLEKLRRLPKEYFEIKSEDRAKIPNEILLLPPADFIKFLGKLPDRYQKSTETAIPSNASVKVWSSEVLEKQIPKQIYSKVPLRYLRHLYPDILQIRKRVMLQIPSTSYTQGNKGIVTWVCKNYGDLCKTLVESIKKNEEVDYSDLLSLIPAEQPKVVSSKSSPKSNNSTKASRNPKGRDYFSRGRPVELDIEFHRIKQ